MPRTTSFIPALGSALLCGCAATIVTSQPVEPPAEPPPPPEQGRPTEPAPPASPAPTLHFGVDGPVVGWITDPEAAQQWISGQEQDGWITLRPPIHSARTRSGLIVHARADAIAAPLPELEPPIRSATGHIFTVDLEDGTPLADFFCDEIEVLDENDGPEPRARVRVRDDEGRWIIEGWVQGEVAERGDDDCPPRIVARRFFFRVSADGVEDPPAPQIPPGYRVARPPDPVPDLDGDLWRTGSEGDQLVCQRWQLQSTAQGLRLERRWVESWGSGRAEMRESQELIGGPDRVFDVWRQHRAAVDPPA